MNLLLQVVPTSKQNILQFSKGETDFHKNNESLPRKGVDNNVRDRVRDTTLTQYNYIPSNIMTRILKKLNVES